MKLRFLTTYDKDEVNSEKTLQFWNNEFQYWEDVSDVRISEEELIHEIDPNYIKQENEINLSEFEHAHEKNEYYRQLYYKKKGWIFTPRLFKP